MSVHHAAESESELSELIDRALRGQEVVVMRHGKPVAEVRPIVTSTVKPVTAEAIEWLRARRVPRRSDKDAGTLVSEMRDEEQR